MFHRAVLKQTRRSLCERACLQDLCERHEKGVLHEHQRALHKYSMMKRQMMSATVQPKEQASVEQLESRIVQVISQFVSLDNFRPSGSFLIDGIHLKSFST